MVCSTRDTHYILYVCIGTLFACLIWYELLNELYSTWILWPIPLLVEHGIMTKNKNNNLVIIMDFSKTKNNRDLRVMIPNNEDNKRCYLHVRNYQGACLLANTLDKAIADLVTGVTIETQQ